MQKDRKGSVALTCAVIGLGAATMLAINVLHPKTVEAFSELKKRQLQVSGRCVDRAMALAEAGCYDKAFKYLQYAVANAMTQEARADAGLHMGEFLVERARTDPIPYALMAKQYLNAVLDIEERPEARIRAHRSIMTAATLMKDMVTFARHAGKALELAHDDNTRAELLLSKMDTCLELGTWEDFGQIKKQATSYVSSPKWQHEFAMRQAMACEQVMMRSDWFEDWIQHASNREPSETDRAKIIQGNHMSKGDVALLRSKLYDETVRQFRDLADCGVEKTASEALFRSARLSFHEGRYDEARRGFYEFLDREPGDHLSETLLMMTRIARADGQQNQAETMISTFLDRFPWNSAAVDVFVAIIDRMENEGREKEALSLIESYLHLPAAKKRLPDLLMRAGRLAESLGLHSKAEEHYRNLLSLVPRDDLAALAMLQLAAIHLKQDDLSSARQWLVRYLNRFPYDARQADAFFMLLDVLRKGDSDGGELIAAAATAVNRYPEDKRTPAALMGVAKKLEAMGLYSLASQQYSKLALLRCVTPADSETPDVPERPQGNSAITTAVLGNARCLLKLGQTSKADHLLRELCNSLASGSTRSEAAYYWAMIALDLGQHTEAARRLDMVDEKNAPSDIAARTTFEAMLLDIAAGKRSAMTVDLVLDRLKDVPALEHDEFVRKAYMTCFDTLQKDGDTNGMRSFFDSAASGHHANQLPLTELAMRLARSALAKNGVGAFIECLNRNSVVMKKEGIDASADISALNDRAVKVEKTEERVKAFLKNKGDA